MEVRMRSAGRYFLVLAVLSLSIGLVAGGCSEDETICPVCPGTPSPSMDNLWPNEDGNSWTYDWMQRIWEQDPWTLYENPGDVPPVPSLEYVEGLLGDESTGADADTSYGIFRLEFDGIGRTLSGASGQNLVEMVYQEFQDDIPVVSFEAVFLDRLRIARPDLEDAVMNRIGSLRGTTDPAVLLTGGLPLFLHGGIWEKTAEYIGTYGDVDTLLAWKFLESEISEGHEFTFQLLPSITSNIFLLCKVFGHSTVETGHGTYKRAVECLYIIDYGVVTVYTVDGTRYRGVYDYGTITYAPGTGPVVSYERMLIDTSVPDGPGFGDNRLELIGAGND